MAYYYYLDSAGEDTNLQLFSFIQAKRYWKALERDYAEFGEDTPQMKERCVFVLATMGLSISQLLGQNNPNENKDVPYPIDIFKSFVKTYGLNEHLINEFCQFNYFYNGCRHFGRTTEIRDVPLVSENPVKLFLTLSAMNNLPIYREKVFADRQLSPY
jgi:hypothetical protein